MKKIYILSLLLTILCLASCSKAKDYNVNDYRTTMQFHDDFEILQITDLAKYYEKTVPTGEQKRKTCGSIALMFFENSTPWRFFKLASGDKSEI